MGTDVRAHLSLSSVLRPRLPQSTSLACEPDARGRHQLQTVWQCFTKCSTPERLQQLADSLDPRELSTCGQKWLARLTPFFNAKEREEAGCQHRLFFSQIEFCDNLIFHRRAALDSLGERLLDAKAPFQLAANDHLASGINSVDLEYRLWRRPNRLS